MSDEKRTFLGPESRVTIYSALAVIGCAVTTTYWVISTLNAIERSIARVEEAQQIAWQIPDMERWTTRLELRNPTLIVPDTIETVQRRPATRGATPASTADNSR